VNYQPPRMYLIDRASVGRQADDWAKRNGDSIGLLIAVLGLLWILGIYGYAIFVLGLCAW